jgi:intein/homing endonuclease
MGLNIDVLKKSKDLALFLGMLAGDGCLSIKYNGAGYRIYPISFYNTNKKKVELFADLFNILFSIKGRIRCRIRKRKKPLWEFEKYSVHIYKIINSEFGIANGKKAKWVRIPSFILYGGNESKKAFFFGLLITDGCVRKTGDILFHSSSKQLLLDLNQIINDVWSYRKDVKTYLQKDRFVSYQLNLNKAESSLVLSRLPRSHNLVVR